VLARAKLFNTLLLPAMNGLRLDDGGGGRGWVEVANEERKEIVKKNVNWIIVNMYWIATLRRACENCFAGFLRKFQHLS
jgi:hypothetical protein